ncbi:DUF3575 domain-containing protein [Riemerella columbina]|uniref:DUF3575 domain-containing protein n=1 Tax=Riemerella columbina TaxID=103810 RepID=UPI00266FA95D|nr:DUF3575 domain-containing protein [Riemerella columbina]WKS94859.1 DUF3575 domain-containing protein [Riemerella columbina]
MMKKNAQLLFLLGLMMMNAQTRDTLSAEQPHALYIKGNALTLPVLVFNFGLEYQLSPKWSLQGDAFASPWKSVNDKHYQIYMGHLEGRYYFKTALKGWYVGLNAGFGLFDLTKWNYLHTNKFQRGYNYMLGATVGFQYQWKDRWNLDVFLGGGNSQGFYHGYEPSEEPPYFMKRYEHHPKNWNRSGEWLLYRGGIMISYKIQ